MRLPSWRQKLHESQNITITTIYHYDAFQCCLHFLKADKMLPRSMVWLSLVNCIFQSRAWRSGLLHLPILLTWKTFRHKILQRFPVTGSTPRLSPQVSCNLWQAHPGLLELCRVQRLFGVQLRHTCIVISGYWKDYHYHVLSNYWYSSITPGWQLVTYHKGFDGEMSLRTHKVNIIFL